MVQKEYFKSQIDVRVNVANRFVRTVHFNATVDNDSSLKRVLTRNVRFYSKIHFS